MCLQAACGAGLWHRNRWTARGCAARAGALGVALADLQLNSNNAAELGPPGQHQRSHAALLKASGHYYRAADLLIEKLERRGGAQLEESLLKLAAAERHLNLFEMTQEREGGFLYWRTQVRLWS
jgi:DNA-binding transcriptional MocR family regulator